MPQVYVVIVHTKALLVRRAPASLGGLPLIVSPQTALVNEVYYMPAT